MRCLFNAGYPATSWPIALTICWYLFILVGVERNHGNKVAYPLEHNIVTSVTLKPRLLNLESRARLFESQ